MAKENIPLELLDILKLESNPDLSLLTVRTTSGFFLLVPKELDPEHCFFSVIKKAQKQVNGAPTNYEITFKPSDRNNAEAYTGSKNLEQIKRLIQTWLSYIKEYMKGDTILDDPFINAYKKEFEAKITILDSDAEFAPFDLERQLEISKYLARFDTTIEKYKLPENEKLFSDIQKDIEKLRSEITSQPKQRIVQRLALIWAKSRKLSLDLIKEVFVEIISTTIAKMING